jgi:hypothetical protein
VLAGGGLNKMIVVNGSELDPVTLEVIELVLQDTESIMMSWTKSFHASVIPQVYSLKLDDLAQPGRVLDAESAGEPLRLFMVG